MKVAASAVPVTEENPTPNVSFSYDPYFRRITSMADGTGVRIYFYQPVGSPGALRPALEASPNSNSLIEYRYDALSRLVARTVDTSTETFAYDNLSRLIIHGTPMGTFNLAYLGQTGQITDQQISTETVSTSWVYDTNTNDRRLKSITNSGAARSYTFATTPENLITQIQEIAPDGSAFPPKTWEYSYDGSYRLTAAKSSAGSYGYGLDSSDNITSYQSPTGTRPASYNNLNQLTEFSGQPLVYDANGNLLSDGIRSYRWDAENRLIEVTNAATPFSSTSFTYDGLGRRVTISSHDKRRLHLIGPQRVLQARTATNLLPTAETRYLWCGEMLCQARDSNDIVIHRYYSEGELLPQSNTSMYYAQDQLGSVRDVLSTQNGDRLASVDYDPYGNATQTSGVGTDFGYAGLFNDQEDGLDLSRYRTYYSATSRWSTRDPMTELAGFNLYSYTYDLPTSLVDPTGLCPDKVNCATLLPNGLTVGQIVRKERADLQEVYNTQLELMKVGIAADPLAALTGAFAAIAWPHGPIDFKNTFRGKANATTLGLAGNFAYYAIGSGFLPDIELDAGAGVYGLYAVAIGQKSWSSLTGPFLSDSGAASVRDAALAAKGCEP